MPVSEEVCLTATVDILRAIMKGSGPRRQLMMLRYSGRQPGQLENEIAENGWLTCPATESILFSSDMPRTYERVMAGMGGPGVAEHELRAWVRGINAMVPRAIDGFTAVDELLAEESLLEQFEARAFREVRDWQADGGAKRQSRPIHGLGCSLCLMFNAYQGDCHDRTRVLGVPRRRPARVQGCPPHFR